MIVAEILRGLVGDKAANWDPVGLQLGDADAEASSVGVCHEVTNRVVEEAGDLDLLITYHPLLFRPTQRLRAGHGAEGRALQLIKRGVNLAVVHTGWDAAPGGTADALAATIGLTDVRSFGLIEPALRKKLVTFVPAEAVDAVTNALVDAGAGTIGNYRGCSFRSEGVGTFRPEIGASPTIGKVGEEEKVGEVRLEMLLAPGGAGAAVAALIRSHPYEEPAFDLIDTVSNAGLIGRVGTFEGNLADLSATLRSRLRSDPRISIPAQENVQRVAVLPGSGGSFIADAAASGADVYVTGDISHHQFVEAADRGLSAIDVGHAASEQPGVKALFDLVAKMIPDVMDLSYDPTPWHQ